jgi:hypothetical protein
MADLLAKQAALAIDPVFRARVELAMFIALTAVQGEAIGGMTTAIYGKRQVFATAALGSPNGYIDRFAWGVASNATIGSDITAPIAIASSTAVNPCVVTTAAAHGFVNGDTVAIAGHAVNTAINGGWIVTNLTSTTFSIPVLGIAAGSGTGSATKQPSDSDIQFTVNSLVSDFAGVTGLD